MEIFKRLLTEIKYKNPVVALGVFDGVHVGHASIIKRAVQIAKDIDGTAFVFTFSNHPLSILNPQKEPLAIGSNSLRRQLFAELGVQVLIEIPFTKEFSKKSPEDFLLLLKEKIAPAYLVTGFNYTFGKAGKGNSRMLIRESENYGFKAEICPAITVDKKNVSSTRIRALIAEGNLEEVNTLLGRNFTYVSKVVHGDRRGRILGFPTANLETSPKRAMLPNGAYAVNAGIYGKNYCGIANIGDNPTFNTGKRRLEVYIDNFNDDIYGQELAVSFIKKLREEQKFNSTNELVAQLRQDLRKAQAIWIIEQHM